MNFGFATGKALFATFDRVKLGLVCGRVASGVSKLILL